MKKLLSFSGVFWFSTVLLSVARATLLGVSVTPPVISYISTASTATRYDPVSQIFTVNATPSTIQFSPTEPTLTVLPPRSMTINIQVDNTGALVGSVGPGPDLVISGRVTRVVGGTTNVYSGLLLTGEVTAFGSFDSGGTVDDYDFRFTPTGGLLLQFYQCDHIGVTLTSEGSTFTGSFATNFQGQAKGNVGLEDLIPPMVTCPSNITAQCNASSGGQHGSFVSYPDPVGSDNCTTNLTFVYTPPSGSFFALDPEDLSTNYVVTLTATDLSGNQSSCSFTVTVEDTTAPAFNVANPIIGQCEENPFVLTNDVGQCSATFTFAIPTATDQCCTNGLTVTVSAVDQSNAVILLTNNGDGTMTGHFPVTCTGSNVITSVATDGRGNTSQAQCEVLVVDDQIPVISCASNQVVECTANTGTGGAVNFQEPTAYDNCPNLTISCVPTNGSVLPLGTNLIVYTASDCSGNTNQCTFDVIVQDTTPPAISCPTNITVQCGQPTDPSNTGTATANDTCDSNPTVTFTDVTSGTCPVMISRTWVAADHNGNTNQCLQVITVTNATPPTVTVPTGSNLGCNPTNLPTDVSVQALVTATDTCSTPTITVTHNDVLSGCTVTRTFTVTAADACNNPSAPQTVVYTWTADTTAPTVTVPTGSILGCNPTNQPTDVSVKALVGATDTCSTPVVTVTHVDVPSGCGITRTFTVTAADACNNVSAPQTVVYSWTVDTTAPTVTVPTGSILGCNPTNLPTDVSVKALVTATDTCSTPVVTVTHVDVPSACGITRTFTVTAADACNNVSAPQTVVYSWTIDTTAPTVTVPTGSILGCNPTNLPTDVSVKALVGATDTCSTPVVTVTHVDVPSGCGITRTFTVTAADACNNVSAPQTVVYSWTVDTTAPTVTVPTGSILGCNPTNLPTDVSVKALVGATDTCSTPVVTVSHVDVPSGCGITRTFTVTAADACNNVSAPKTVVYSWTVDTTAPTVTVPTGSNLGCNPKNLPTAASVKALVTATDTCSVATVNVSSADTSNGCTVTRTFTVTATDGCGNTSAPQTVVYSWTADTTGPTLSGCTNQVVYQQQTVTNGQVCIKDVFNCQPISKGNWIWFNGTLNPCTGITNKTYTVSITGQTITGTIGGSNVSLTVPNAQITYSSTTTNATTTYTNGIWVTTCPLASTLAGDQFGSGLPYQLPFNSAGNGTLTWCASFCVTPGVAVNWHWAASVYTNFSATCTTLGVKPVDDTKACSYKNSDAACTPENFKQYCVFGARSGIYGDYCGNRTFPWVCNKGTTTVCSGGVVQYTPPTASSTCGGVPNLVCVPQPGVGFVTGSTNVICTAVDDCGSTNSCSFTVILESPLPTIACPGNITTNTTATSCSQMVKWTVTGSSACGGSVTTSCSPTNGSTFAKGTTPVTCMAIQAGAGTNSCSFTVTVNDTTKPTIACPGNITTNACTAVVNFAPTVSDNCPGVTYSCIPASGSTFAYGTNTVTCTATDTSGNTASCSFKVILNSAVPPCMVGNPTATAGTGKVTVTWPTESMGTAPFTYTVKRSTTSGGSYTNVATGLTTLTYTDTAVVHGTRYYYCVTAANCMGTSANSPQAYCTP